MSSGLVSIGKLAKEVGLSPNWLRHLADTDQIPSTRSPGGHRRFDVDAVRVALAVRHRAVPATPEVTASAVSPARKPDWDRRLPLEGLQEHEVWTQVRNDLGLNTTTNGGRIAQHAFNEMLNNAIDHSQGTTAHVSVWCDESEWAFRIEDDGQGVFAHVRERLGLADEKEAVAELTKGKVTTMPDRHTGEGIFFTSKAVDVFQLTSGHLRWTVDNLRGDQALGLVPESPGTSVFVQVDPETSRELRAVFSAYTEDFEFVRSRPSVKLFGLGVAFVSRSEARRLLEGMDRFSEVEVDFEGVQDVGQGFVDELVRVWPSQNPGTHIIPVNMNEAVEFMVRRGLPPRDA